jgi:hypothetical protein
MHHGLQLATALGLILALGTQAEATRAVDAPQPASPSMCAAGDTPVLSCPLATGGKTVSICARSSSANGAARFYYAFGRSRSAPEMTYPGAGSGGSLTHTYLSFAGNTGGYAFGFEKGGYRYAVYSISGSYGMQKGGVVVSRQGEAKPISQATCRAGAITESHDDALFRAYSKLPEDPAIARDGLQVK